LTEWYVNDHKGLEQGFTLNAPPARSKPQRTSWIELDLELSGNLKAGLNSSGGTIEMTTPGGVGVVHYGKLEAFDASGRKLATKMELDGSQIALLVDTQDALYPVLVDPLATSAAWTAESDQGGAAFGYSVAGAGDVNGDGYSDVIVGARRFDAGVTDGGRAFLYLGSAAGLSSSPAWTAAESDLVDSGFGVSVSTAGDVNGDGYSDAIVGAFGYGGGGSAFLYHGSATGLSASPDWTAEGGQNLADFGQFVSTAGDVNGDGFSDVAVSAPRYDNDQFNEGRVFLYLGSSSGLSTSPAWTAESDQIGALFGSAHTAGDVNGDGYSDLIVSSPYYDHDQTDEGRIFLYLGSTAGLGSTPDWTAESDQADAQFASSVSTAGDVNGDGYSDVVAGAPLYFNGEYREGRVFVYFGSATGLGSSAGWTAESDQTEAMFGMEVSTAGDVNGDGYADVLIGASGYENGESEEGRAFLYLGSAAGLGSSPAWTAESDQADASFGTSVSTAGDINGDGYSDVIVGAPQYDNTEADEGRAFVYVGSASGLAQLPEWIFEADQAGAGLGSQACTAGDVNGDGYADVIVSATSYDSGQAGVGRIFLFLGSAQGLSSSPASTIDGDQSGASFGESIASAGDVNGDGYSDVVVGAYLYDHPDNMEGRAFLYLGSATGLNSTPAWTAEGNQDSAWFAGSVSSAGDVNGDGYSDVIVGAEWYDNGQTNEGRVFLYLGSPDGLSPFAAWTAEGNDYGSLGRSVSTAGDVNGDGYSDVIVGGDGYTNGQQWEGRARVYLGSAAGLSTTPAWTVESNLFQAQFGQSVSTAGDVNGDGYSDVIVGAWNYSGPETQEGAAFVYLGSAAGLSSSPAWTAEGNRANGNFGIRVATAGDVNGDGYSDVIVGASYYDNPDNNEGAAFLYLGSPTGLSSSPEWTAESNQADAGFGNVGPAGDVNGDGYSDVVVGGPGFDDGATDEGIVVLYYGNLSAGLSLNPRQRRFDDTAATQHLSLSENSNGVRLASFGRSPYGRGKVKMQWEVKPLGTPFNGADTGQSASWVDTGTAGASLNEQIGSLTADTRYHWRMRLLYNPATTPFQPYSRWISPFGNGWQEADFHTDGVVPTAEAGADQTVKENTLVTLDGSHSRDPNEQTLTYAWTQLSGTAVVLSDASSATPTFTAPILPSSSNLILTFRLTVNDGEHPATDQVVITVTQNTFTDVPETHIFYPYVEKIVARSITAGCGYSTYCVDNPVTRAQMAVFLLKAKYTSTYTPPAATGLFTDVPAGYWARTWVEQFAHEGITAGCGAGIFCPDTTVTRAQMAVFLLKAKHGTSYVPPDATGMFTDVPEGHWARVWIEQLAREGITAGCSATTYCPDNPVTRGQMAVFLSRTFGF